MVAERVDWGDAMRVAGGESVSYVPTGDVHWALLSVGGQPEGRYGEDVGDVTTADGYAEGAETDSAVLLLLL